MGPELPTAGHHLAPVQTPTQRTKIERIVSWSERYIEKEDEGGGRRCWRMRAGVKQWQG